MSKFIKIIWVIVGIGLCYLLMLITIPFLADTANTVNTSMAATTNMSNFPGASGALVAAPWVLWFAPGTIGIALVVIILRSGEK